VLLGPSFVFQFFFSCESNMFLKIIKHQNVDFTREESWNQSRKENKSTVWGMKYDLRKKNGHIVVIFRKKRRL